MSRLDRDDLRGIVPLYAIIKILNYGLEESLC